MAFTPKQMSLIVATFGVLSFIFGVIAENKKPPSGTPITGKGVVICKYPSDPTVVLGYLSFAFLVVSSVTGFLSLFYPYKGKSIPQAALFQNTSFLVFFNIAFLPTKAVTQNRETLGQLKSINANAEQEREVERVRQREELIAKVDSMKKKLPWLKCDMKKAEYIEAKEKEKDAKKKFDELAKAMNELQGPIE